MLSVAPVWAGAAAVFLWMWPWRPALGHLVVLGLVGMMVAELSLRNFPKIPFTCSYLPGKSYAHMAIIAFIGMVFLVTKGADLERQALGNPAGYGAMLVVFAGAAVCARWRARGTELRFEEEPTPAIFSLNLRRDGASGV